MVDVTRNTGPAFFAASLAAWPDVVVRDRDDRRDDANIIGVTVMSWLASGSVGLRHPASWAMAGAATLGIPAWLSLDSDPGHAFTAGWAAIGALSAVIGRSRLWWDDPATA